MLSGAVDDDVLRTLIDLDRDHVKRKHGETCLEKRNQCSPASSTSGRPWTTVNVNSVSSPKKNEAVATVAASIPTELDKFRARDRLLSLLTSKLDGDIGRTGRKTSGI